MALSDNLKNAGDEIERLNDLGTEFSAVYKDIGEALKGLARDSKDFGSGIGDAEKLSRDLAKSAQELAGFTKEDLKDRKKVADFTKKADALNSKRAKLQSQIRTFQAQTVNATKAENSILEKVNRNLQNSSNYTQEITDGFEEILGTSKKIEKSNPFKGLSDVVSSIPIVSKAFSEFENATEAFNDELVDSGNKLTALYKGFQQFGGLAVKGSIGLFVKGIIQLSNQSTDLSRNLNMSAAAAEKLAIANDDAAASMEGISGKQITQAQLDLANAMGTTAVLSEKTAANFTVLTKRLGLSVDQATELVKLSEAFGNNSKEQSEVIAGTVLLNNAQTDSSIKYQDILKDISSTSKAVLLANGGNAQQLAKSAIEARKLGINLNDADNIAQSLLNFEQSISAELEAELLTGKNLNFERARSLALQGDSAGAAKLVLEQVQDLTEEQQKNPIIMQAMAEAAGMTREQLAATIIEQKALTALNAEDKNDLKDKVKLELDRINAIGNAEEREIARKKLIAKLGSDELIRQQEQTNFQEKLEIIADKILAAFKKLGPSVDKLVPMFEMIANNANTIAYAIMAIAGVSLVGKFARLLKVFKGLGGQISKLKSMFGLGSKTAASGLTKSSGGVVMKNTGKKVYGAAGEAALKAGTGTLAKTGTKQASKTGAKLGAKLGGKTLLKRIPILGSLVGVGFAIDRAIKGDGVGALMELGSAGLGLLDLVAPGVGTGLSLAADAGIAARDFKRAGTITPTATPMATGGIVNRATNAIVGEAGPEAVIPLNEFYRKFDELISVVKEGGDVYLDSTKMGRAMAVSSFKLQ